MTALTIPSPLSPADARTFALLVRGFASDRWFDAFTSIEERRWTPVQDLAWTAAHAHGRKAMLELGRAAVYRARGAYGSARKAYRALAFVLFRAARWPS